MNKTLLVLTWGLASTAFAGDTLLLTGVQYLNPTCQGWVADRPLLVAGGHIADLASERVNQEARRIDLSGMYVIPGLIDLHTHLLLHPYDEASWNNQVLREALELRTIRATVAARATLRAGFTTIRELGTEGAGYADVALRDAIAQGLIEGPRIIASTRALVATGCYGPAGFDPRWVIPRGAQVADGVAGVRRVVREQIAAGADWIKVYADYRRRPGAPSTPTYSQDELNAIVDEARSAGLKVAAHAVTSAAVERAVLAGVATIEHGTAATAEVLQLMRRHDVALCPTLAAAEALARYTENPARSAQAREMFKRALDSGVTIACGSDAGVFAHGGNTRELQLMVEWGMSPDAALRAATCVAADVLGRPDLGRIAPGQVADLVVLTRDPLKDVTALYEVVMVIKDGTVIVDHRE